MKNLLKATDTNVFNRSQIINIIFEQLSFFKC